MANVKITELTALTDPASSDVLPIVDVGADTTKKVTIADLLENAGDGAAATPAFSFDNDKSVGMWRPGSEQLAFSTSGTTRLFINSSGQAVIGGTSPLDSDKQLTLTSTTTSGGLGILSPNNGRGDIFFGDAADDNVGQIKYSHSNDSLTIRTNASDRFTIDSSGNVGIGTTVPGNPLVVKESSDICIELLNSTDASILTIGEDASRSARFIAPSGDLVFQEGGSEAMRIGSSGAASFKGGTVLVEATSNTTNAQLSLGRPNSTSAGYIRYINNENAMAFRTNGSGEDMRLDSNGRLGLGTSVPDQLLHLKSSSSFLAISNSGDTGDSGILFRRTDNNQNRGYVLYDFTNDALKFRTSTNGSGESMRLDSSGNVGIGTTSPGAKLELRETNGTTIRLRRNSSTAVANDLIGKIDFFNNDSSTPGSRVTATVGAYAQSTAGGTYLSFSTAVNGGSNTERMRLNSSGHLGINTQSPGDLVEIKTGLDRSLLIRGNRTSSPVDLFAGNPSASYGLRDMSFSANTLSFGTGASSGTTATERLRIDSSGAASFKSGTVLVEATSNTTNAQLSLGRPNSTSAGYIRYINNENAMAFRTNGSGEDMRLDSNGRLGLGTSVPDQLLHLKSSSSFLAISNSGDTGDSGILFRRTDNNQNRGYVLYDFTNDALKFRTSTNGSGESMRLDSSGNVGIGTTSPGAKLELRETNGTTIRLRRNSSTAVANDLIGKIDFFNNDSSTPGSRVTATVGAYAQSTAGGTYLSFSTAVNGGSNTERMRLNSSGHLGINTQSPGDLVEIKTGLDRSLLIRGNRTSSPVDLFAGNPSASYGLRDMSFSANTLRFGIGASTGTSATERMRLDSSGRLLVGTSTALTTPTPSRFQLSGTDFGTSSIRQTRYQTGEAGASLILSHARGTEASPTILADGDELGKIRWNAYDGTDFMPVGAEIKANIDGTIQENQSPGRLVFSTTASGASLATERMRITSTGRVGIGTTSPDTRITIGKNSNADFTSNSTLRSSALTTFENTETTTAIVFKGINTNPDKFIFADNEGGTQSFGLGHMQGGVRTNSVQCQQTGDIVFNRQGSESGRFDSSGRLLVGTTSSSSNSRAVFQANTADSNGAGIIRIAGGSSSPNSGNTLGAITFTDSGHLTAAAVASHRDGGTWTSGSSQPARLVFSTCADGAATATERMRIGQNGRPSFYTDSDALTIGNAAAAGTSNRFIQGGHGATAVNTGTTSFIVYTNGNVENANNSYGSISDVKLKENIVDASSQWDDIKDLRVRNYNFIEGQTHTQIGLVAQEVETVSPGLVTEAPDTDEEGNDLGTVTKSVSYSVLYMKAVKALQEAMERIETLEASNADLLARVSALEAS